MSDYRDVMHARSAKITCLACGGKGYVARLTMDGTPRG